MFIAVRKEPNGLYIDKEVYLIKGFTDEILSNPPCNYTKVEIEDKYADCINKDFNEDLTFSVEKYNARKQKEVNQKRIAEIKIWFKEYDNQVKQYQRCIRLGIDFDKDIIELDNQAKAYQEELRMYNDYVEQCKSEAKMGG
jgi:hypothetical protein